jgi:putative ABC transport system substrate-binding protein
MRSRREFITLLGSVAATWPLVSTAETLVPAHRIGVLAQDLQPGLLETFRDQLRKLGHVEGASIVIELRNAAGRNELLPVFAQELLRLKVDVIVAINTPAAQAAKKATVTVPIVMMRVADPVKSGLVAGFARPGGNVTGLSFMPDALGPKGVELLTEDYEHAFEMASRVESEALFVMDDGAITKHRREILALASKRSLPVVSIYRDFAEAGGLIAYGPNLNVVYRRAADYVDKLMKGERASDLPVEQPVSFDLVINLKTARALGLTIPQSVLIRADEVIE